MTENNFNEQCCKIMRLNLLLRTEGSVCLYSLREQKANHNTKAVTNLASRKTYV
jgi:hypothetical protein